MNSDVARAELGLGNRSARRVKRFFATPKGLVLLILAGLLLVGVRATGSREALPELAVAIGVAAFADVAAQRLGRGAWVFPDGAIISGAIVGMLLSPIEPLYLVAATSFLAISTKHLFRVGSANVFNPAALAVVISSVRSKTGGVACRRRGGLALPC